MGTPEPRGKGRTLITPLIPFGAGSMDHVRGRGKVNYCIVEVETDAGIKGYGTVGAANGAAIYALEEHLGKIIQGESPFDTEKLWEKMFRATLNYGRKGMAIEAISAIDIALWDVKGKVFNQPLYNLIGGRVSEKIPVYASRLYNSEDLDEVVRECQAYLAQGFKAMKLRFGYGPTDGDQGVAKNRKLLKTVRETVGDEIQLMADVYMGWDFGYFLQMRPILAEYNLRWLEEPVMPDDYMNYAKIKRAANDAGILISGGEHEFTRYGYKLLFENECIDILQPDVNRMGGVTEALKVWAMAAAYNIPVIPHAGQAHNYHLVTSHFNSPMAEYFPPPSGAPDPNEIFWRALTGEPIAEDGFVTLSNAPGLGLEPVWDVIDRYRVS